MGLLNTEDDESIGRTALFGHKLREIIVANICAHRTIVIVTDDDWSQANNEENILTFLKDFYVGIFPKPCGQYGDNFLSNVVELFNQKGSDLTVFNHAERIDDSPNYAQWEYLITKAAEGAHFVNETDGRAFDYRRRGVLLLCSRVPEFVKRRPDLWPAILEMRF